MSPTEVDIQSLPWVRTSERLTLNQCPQKWWWAYEDRLRGKSSPALRFGTLVHSALEEFYQPGLKRGPKPAETFERLYDEEVKTALDQFGFRDEDDEWHNARELGVAMLEAYYDKYGKDNEWKVIATEQPFWQVVRSPVTGKPAFVYVGVVDGVWQRRTDKTFWIVDHKTTSDDPTKKAAALVMDEQAGAYWTYGKDWLQANGFLGPKVRLEGMLYNFLRKGKPDERPKNAAGQSLNKDGTVSLRQPTPLFHREPVFRNEADGEMVRHRIWLQWRRMRSLRKDPDTVYKIPGTLHSPHCGWCEFRDMCEIHEAQGDWELIRDSMYRTYDPYEQHEIQDGDQAR